MTEAKTTQTISITRALTLLKGLNEKIATSISTGTFVSAAIGEKNRTTAALSETKSKIQGSHDRVISLMQKRNEIKAKIVKSNADTTITFREKEISVAEAIEQRTNTREVLKSYLTAMISQLATANMLVERAENTVRDEVTRSEATIYGRADAGNVNRDAELTVLRDAKNRINGAELVDPVEIQKKIDDVREQLTDLDGELDSLLSESNSKTLITIPV